MSAGITTLCATVKLVPSTMFAIKDSTMKICQTTRDDEGLFVFKWQHSHLLIGTTQLLISFVN